MELLPAVRNCVTEAHNIRPIPLQTMGNGYQWIYWVSAAWAAVVEPEAAGARS